MATAAGSSAESEALRLAFSYLVNSIDSTTVLPAALSAHLISESQRSECASETAPFKRVEKFLGHLQRAVNGDSNKYHTFIRVLKETGQVSIASRLGDELTKASRLMPPAGEQFVVSDELLEDLADLRVEYASLLYEYKNVLECSPEAQKKFVELLPGLIGRSLGPDRNFQSYFNKLVDEEVSLFNVTYLKKLCRIFPADVSTTTKKLVDSYKQQCQHFMASKTVNQFKALFPASATPSKLLAEKFSVELKFLSDWGDHTLDDLKRLVGRFGVPGNHLHLSKVKDGCIAVFWLCSISFIKELKAAIVEATDLLQTEGVLKVFIEEELVLECSQPDQQELCTHKTETLYFVDEPESEYLCQICTELLTQPFLTDCGHYVCQACRKKLLTTQNDECPTCRESNMLSNARLNRHLQRQINSIKVHCRHHKKGCEWVGEVRNLQDHLDPEKGECAIRECPFDCGKYCRKGEMKNHMKHHCVKRPTTCEYCGYHNTHDIVTENHYPACLQFLVTCPNKCTVKRYKRYQLQQHLDVCPLQRVLCPCSNTGCSVQLPRREMAAHTLQQHNQVRKQIIKQAVAITPPPATVSPQYLYNLPPVVFTITDYHKKKQANKVWTSPPYYTHTRGYKFCLKVYPNGNGSGKGTHISVYACLMRGEYDNELKWPFEGDFMFELLNWKEDKNHLSQSVNLNKYTDPYGTYTSRIIHEEITTYGYCFSQFISHTNLKYNSTINTEYVQEDCLRLRVGVAMYSTALRHKTPSWQDPLTTTQSVCEFTLTEFSKRKQFNNRYYSPPFYTHPQGYKFCLQVDANGQFSGEGTHVSIFAHMIRGEHDQQLHWPFTGGIIFELLNWREDKEHHKITMSIEPSDGYDRVTEGTYGNSRGYDQFISHPSLPYNSTTNTEYLQEDCLRLRVSVNIIYSTALLHKTPSWQDPLTTTRSVCEFTLTEFSKRKKFNNHYVCPPFYTHPQGYKLCLEVYANGGGSAEGTHISMYVCLIRGEYDDSLNWPFEADIIIELLNWSEDKNHHSKTISFNRHTNPDGGYRNRVTEQQHSDNSWGDHQFIFHSSLPYNSTTNTEYLQEDCLRLRVKEVVFYSTALLHKTPSWQDLLTTTQSVCEFTLTEFSKRKQFNNYCVSPPFHTHPGGYKMVLFVAANGYKSAKGTHISVGPRLMKGEHDDDLRWPFVGDVIVELLNWRVDNEHQMRILEFNSDTDPDGKCSALATNSFFAEKPWYGRYDLFSHSSLSYDPSTNTEYLHDDCLRLRVRNIRVYSM